jgi:hypothetical protein
VGSSLPSMKIVTTQWHKVPINTILTYPKDLFCHVWKTYGAYSESHETTSVYRGTSTELLRHESPKTLDAVNDVPWRRVVSLPSLRWCLRRLTLRRRSHHNNCLTQDTSTCTSQYMRCITIFDYSKV